MTFPLPYPRVIEVDERGRERLDALGVQANFDAILSDVPGDAVQGLASAGRLMDTGVGTWTWPGGSVKSGATVVPHRLNGVPLVVVVFPNQTQGATEVLAAEAYSYTGSQFSSRARFFAATPAAGTTASFVWLAIR